MIGWLKRRLSPPAEKPRPPLEDRIAAEVKKMTGGTWVKVEDMHPAMNVYRRLYATASGDLRVYYPEYPWRYDDPPVAWYFPPVPTEAERS